MDQNGRMPRGWDDIPTADPQIQKDYEAALGAFLVAFTQIENIVSNIIVLAQEKAERKDIVKCPRGDSFPREAKHARTDFPGAS